jgi:hypothetical protein
MKNKAILLFPISLILLCLSGCKPAAEVESTVSGIQKKVDEYIEVSLTSDLINNLTDNQKKLLPLLFDAADQMEEIYWHEAYGDKDELLSQVTDPAEIQFIRINYGPWDRLNNNQPFIDGFGQKPDGANFYPGDMTREEFGRFQSDDKTSLYTLVRRDENDSLVTVPYHKAFSDQVEKAAEYINEAAELAEDEGFRNYLTLRANALLSDDYLESDLAWMDMKTNMIDFVVGPIENYEDGLFGYKAAHESFILLKDMAWSNKLDKYASLLPELQKTLPVPEEYKTEIPGSGSDLGVYDVIYYAGDCNAGSKTIAINLPNDERVHIEKGSRKLQLKNAMRYKFEKILVPISEILISDDQQQYITFDAFFENTMFHEVAHGLGIKNTLTDKGTVRKALKELYSPLEEGKADILGLYLITRLAEMGELEDSDLMDNYVTFMAGIFRSVRFGAASSHGKGNMVRFYYFQEMGAFARDPETGQYKIDFDKMTEAMNSLANTILIIQGNGDYDAAKLLLEEKGYIREGLQKDLERISEAGIPRDIRFIQGKTVAGL